MKPKKKKKNEMKEKNGKKNIYIAPKVTWHMCNVTNLVTWHVCHVTLVAIYIYIYILFFTPTIDILN
jgi:hypothetical protein